MFLVRNCFTAKPGDASKLAGIFKELVTAIPIADSRVLTDVTGEYNRVIFEYEVASLGDVESRMEEYAKNPLFQEKMKGYTELWSTGHREILRIR
jgi:hypothetical protein